MRGMGSLLLLVLSMALQGLAWAQPCTVGKVLRVVGTVSVQRADRAFTPFEGITVCRGDHFLTGPASIVELRLRDGSLITVGKDSEFVVHEYRLYQDRPNVALFELARGAFRSITGLITRREHRYEVRTRVGTIGVRGTDFWGGFGLSADGLDVVMLEGHGVYVQAPGGTVELDRAGLGTTVMPGQVPGAAKTWGEAKLGRAMATVTP